MRGNWRGLAPERKNIGSTTNCITAWKDSIWVIRPASIIPSAVSAAQPERLPGRNLELRPRTASTRSKRFVNARTTIADSLACDGSATNGTSLSDATSLSAYASARSARPNGTPLLVSATVGERYSVHLCTGAGSSSPTSSLVRRRVTASLSTLATAPIGIVTSRRPHR